MSEIKTIIKYTGAAVDGKSMDVSDLAPSLIALSDLLKIVNKKYNGERAGLKILVNADLEQNCFELGVELVQNLWESVSQLIEDDKVKTAKQIAEWVGIIGSVGISLYGLIKLLKGKEVESVTKLKQEDGRNNVQIIIKGDGNKVVVPQQVYEIYADKNARKKAVEVLSPLHEDGYDQLEFYKGKKVFEKFTKEDAPQIDCGDCPEVIPKNIVKSAIRTTVGIRKPAYEGLSKWTLVYRKAYEASIEDIEWLNKFQNNQVQAPPGTSLDVELEETIIIDQHGEAIEEPTYTVKKVHGTVSPPQQMTFLEDDDT